MERISYQTDERALLREAVGRLDAVNAVSATGVGSLEIEQVLTVALDRTMEVVGFETGLIFLADSHTGDLVLGAHRGVSETAAGSLRCEPAGDGLLHRVLRSPIPLILDDLSLELPAQWSEGVRTGVLAPLRSNDSAQGILALGTRGIREPRPEEVDLITTVANYLGVVLDNAHLRREADGRLRVQTRLNESAGRILSESELDKIMPIALSSAQGLTGADGGRIALGDHEYGQGFSAFSLPPDPATGPIAAERALDRMVTQTRRPLIIEDYPSYHEAVPAFVAAGLASLIVVPIIYGDHVLGTLALFNLDRSKRFAELDIAGVVELGRQTGIAVENARLYQVTRFHVHQVTRAQEDERKRIARALHDETMQDLVVISRRLESLLALPDQLPAAAQERIAALQELLSETMRGVRHFVHDLRPSILDHLGLLASVEALASDLRQDDGIEATVQVDGETRRLEPEEEIVLFRIAQEALGNIRRHSGATQVEVHVDFGADLVRLSVADNGCGFSLPGRIDDYVFQEKLGLMGMNERARTLGGELEIDSAPGRGTRITVVIPSRGSPEVDLS